MGEEFLDWLAYCIFAAFLILGIAPAAISDMPGVNGYWNAVFTVLVAGLSAILFAALAGSVSWAVLRILGVI